MKTVKLDDYINQNLSEHDIQKVEKMAVDAVMAYESLRQSISQPVKQYIEDNHLKFEEVKQQLGTGTSQTQRIINAQGNFTLETIMKVAKLLGKKPKITFE